ncbi:unnamed protein product [Effrenium voratum]|nr:unnamed protein product [Effrenium voratum]
MASSARVPPMPSSRIPLPFSPEEYAGRLQRVREGMQKEQLDLVVLTEPENIFYLTGYQTVGEPQIQALLLPAEGAPSLVTRLLEVTNATFRSNLQPQNLHVYADFESGIDKVCELLQSFQVSRLGLEMQSRRLLARHWTKLEALAKTKGMKLCEASHLVPRLRLVKTPAELAVLRRACGVCAAGVLAGQEASAGETETEIAGKAYQALAKVGGEYPAFPPFVCIGQNGCLGHYPGSSSGGVLREGEVLFLEIGGCFERYHGAMMRTCFVGHQLPPLLQQAEAAVVAAMDVAAKAMKPGAKAKEVDQVARAALTRADKAWTMSLRSGYSIGIGFYTDWGEAEHFKMDPGSEQVLEEGMVIHLIPWVQVPEYGGVGLSDTVLVTKSGAVSLFEKQIPRKIRLIPPPAERPFGPEQAQRVRRVLGLEPTPLVKLELKDFEGLKSVYVKDESKRMGLQAFKVVGGAYAMLRFMCKRLALPLPEGAKGAEEVQRLYVERFGATTFVTATDGNHGRGVAWAARRGRRRRRGRSGAEITELNYDDTVEMAFKQGQDQGWVVLQDTTAPGYTEIPEWIMQGYTAMVDEAVEATEKEGSITHVVLQMGVGSMAAAVVGYFTARFGVSNGSPSQCPRFLVIEPWNAACGFESAKAGEMRSVEGDLETMVAGLACGVPSSLAWPVLAEFGHAFLRLKDGLAGNGMRLLRQSGVEAGECGGAACGVLQHLMKPSCASWREELGLNSESKVLLINTEGATDPANYQLQMTLPDVEGPELLEMVLGPARKASNGASSSSKRQRVA